MKKILKFFTLLSLVLALAAGCKETKNRRFDTRPITLVIAGNTFHLPQNYTTQGDSLHMRLLMPEFLPRTDENEALIENTMLERYIQINVMPNSDGRKIPNPHFYADNWGERYLKNVFYPNAKFKNLKKLGNGFDYYEAITGPAWFNDLYVLKRKGKITLILECTSRKVSDPPPHPQCAATQPIFGNLTLNYWYPVKYLPQAKEIHSKIETLLVKFRQGGRL